MAKAHSPNHRTPPDDLQLFDELARVRETLLEGIGKVIVGQREVVEELLMALFGRGHCLLVGVPGLAKTLIIRTLSELLDLEFRRIQFTPDLMPSDITGTDIIQEDRATGRRALAFMPGPIFSNIVLADEINRTPPKTQAALLEAMQERQITVGTTRHELPAPFFVLATQNPIEQEGTYPLPEAQLDRFMFNTRIDYPSEQEEVEVVLQTTGQPHRRLQPVLDAETILQLQELVARVPVPEHVAREAVRVVRLSRPDSSEAPDFVRKYLRWGAGTRAGQYLVLGAKSSAALRGENAVTVDDVRRVAPSVLRHRLLTNFNAEADRIDSEEIIRRILEVVDHERRLPPRGQVAEGKGMPRVFSDDDSPG
jgi:MoxR-like ATPase